jgi:hypothetical protein
VLGLKENKKLYGNLYTEITLRKGRLPLLEYPLNVTRRFLYILLPALFKDDVGPQLAVAVVINQLYATFIFNQQPYARKHVFYLELFNEISIMMFIYLYHLFTNFTTPENKFLMGYYYIGIFAFYMGITLSLIFDGIAKK